MITKGQKREIDEMPYEAMLRLHRHAPVGARRLSGEVGDYFYTVMKRKRNEIGDCVHSATSRKVGW